MKISTSNLLKILALVLLIAIGGLLQLLDFLNPQEILAQARSYTDHWWLFVALILVQIVFFTFALPGSMFILVVGALYPPVPSTFILTVGSTLGAIGAFYLSRQLTAKWVERVETTPVYLMLQEHNNFFTLFALRLLPGFPNSVVNYTAGVLKAQLSHFIPAAILALTIKTAIYSHVLYNATAVSSPEELLDIKIIGPLFLLSVLSLIGVLIRYRLRKRIKQTHAD